VRQLSGNPTTQEFAAWSEDDFRVADHPSGIRRVGYNVRARLELRANHGSGPGTRPYLCGYRIQINGPEKVNLAEVADQDDVAGRAAAGHNKLLAVF
jgi:hypothetical protein